MKDYLSVNTYDPVIDPTLTLMTPPSPNGDLLPVSQSDVVFKYFLHLNVTL